MHRARDLDCLAGLCGYGCEGICQDLCLLLILTHSLNQLEPLRVRFQIVGRKDEPITLFDDLAGQCQRVVDEWTALYRRRVVAGGYQGTKGKYALYSAVKMK